MPTPIDLNELAEDIFAANKAKGFWPENVESRNLGEVVALIHSEASELLEAIRKPSNRYKVEPTEVGTFHVIDTIALGPDRIVNIIRDRFKADEMVVKLNNVSEHIPAFTPMEEEVADIIIRCLDLAGAKRLRIQEAIEAKLEYNASRPFKHGKVF